MECKGASSTRKWVIDHPMVGKLGPHALDLSLEEFRTLLKGRRGAIKTFLLDQDRIAGIGNVYVQTPLWRAKIHPLRAIPSLSDQEIAALWQALREVLQGSIDAGGAPFELNLYGQKGGWDDPYLFHWEEGAPCPACGTPLAKIRTGSTVRSISKLPFTADSRAPHFCPCPTRKRSSGNCSLAFHILVEYGIAKGLAWPP
jgi:formamidopyrimidine-DNA glycosylase